MSQLRYGEQQLSTDRSKSRNISRLLLHVVRLITRKFTPIPHAPWVSQGASHFSLTSNKIDCLKNLCQFYRQYCLHFDFIFLWLVTWMSFLNMFIGHTRFSSVICVLLYLSLFIPRCWHCIPNTLRTLTVCRAGCKCLFPISLWQVLTVPYPSWQYSSYYLATSIETFILIFCHSSLSIALEFLFW